MGAARSGFGGGRGGRFSTRRQRETVLRLLQGQQPHKPTRRIKPSLNTHLRNILKHATA